MDNVRPWVRFWGRLLDIMLYSAFLTFLFPALADFQLYLQPHVAIEWQALLHQATQWGLINLAFYIAIESILLSTLGTTLGKWILRVSIKDNQGKKLSLGNSLKRTFLVYFRGFAFFIPIISIVTLIYAYASLSSSGSTSWDKECNITVTHQRIGFLRILAGIILLFFLAHLNNSAIVIRMMTFKNEIMYMCTTKN